MHPLHLTLRLTLRHPLRFGADPPLAPLARLSELALATHLAAQESVARCQLLWPPRATAPILPFAHHFFPVKSAPVNSVTMRHKKRILYQKTQTQRALPERCGKTRIS